MSTSTGSTITPSSRSTGPVWPDGFDRIPDAPWTRAPVDEFGLGYDNVGTHGWYKNLEPTIAQVTAALS